MRWRCSVTHLPPVSPCAHCRSRTCNGVNRDASLSDFERLEFEARPSRDCGLLPLPKGEGWGEGLQPIERSEPPHPNPLPCGERESRRAVVEAVPATN